MTQLLPDEETFIINNLPLLSAQLRHKYPNAVCHLKFSFPDNFPALAQ